MSARQCVEMSVVPGLRDFASWGRQVDPALPGRPLTENITTLPRPSDFIIYLFI